MTEAVASKQKAFQLRGSLFTFTVLQLITADQEAFSQQLTELVKQAPKFFENAPIVIDLQNLSATQQDIDLKNITHGMRSTGLIPVGIRGGSPEHQATAKEFGIAILATSKSEEPGFKTSQPTPAATEADSSAEGTQQVSNLIITKPVRSGQQHYARGGDLIVTAPVSQGAELIADGNIHVYAPLRGRALAGVSGNSDARIFCLNLDAELVSIAGTYVVNEALIHTNKNTPTQVSLEDGKLQINHFA